MHGNDQVHSGLRPAGPPPTSRPLVETAFQIGESVRIPATDQTGRVCGLPRPSIGYPHYFVRLDGSHCPTCGGRQGAEFAECLPAEMERVEA